MTIVELPDEKVLDWIHVKSDEKSRIVSIWGIADVELYEVLHEWRIIVRNEVGGINGFIYADAIRRK